ncbi:MAG: LIC_12616 family protein [Oscillospiraceae bacterium]
MTYNDARSIIYNATASYFSGATVTMAGTKQTKKLKPMVTLKFGALQIGTFPNEVNYEGEPCDYYTASMKLEVQLFTNGHQLSNDGMENTAVGDLTDYVNYMMSKLMTTEFSRKDLTILTAGPVQDVSAVINDTSYEYRAMVEFDVTFTVASVGYGGILDESSIKLDEPDPENPDKVLPPHIEPEWTETDSGGRTAEIAEREVGYFTEVEITETKE